MQELNVIRTSMIPCFSPIPSLLFPSFSKLFSTVYEDWTFVSCWHRSCPLNIRMSREKKYKWDVAIQLQQEVLLSFHNRTFKQRINLQYLQTECAVKSFDFNFKKTKQPSLIAVATCLEVSLYIYSGPFTCSIWVLFDCVTVSSIQ